MTQSSIDWKQFSIEGVVIVGSILLAFWIDATWENYQKDAEGQQLVAALILDIDTTQRHIEDLIDRSERTRLLATQLLEALANSQQSTDLRSLLLNTGSVLVYHQWHPTTDTYDQALGSGDLAAIDSLQIRSALARYSGDLFQIGLFYESAKMQYFDQHEPFLVANTVYSELAASWWKDKLVEAPFSTDIDRLIGNREFWNLLTLKLELEEAILARLESAVSTSNEIRALLEEYSDRT